MMSDGDVSICSSSEESEDESEGEEIPDGIILDFYQEMQALQSNPLGLEGSLTSTEAIESATESLLIHSELGSEGEWPGSHIPSRLPTFSSQGCP